MFKGFEDSYPHLVAKLNDLPLVTPQQVHADPVLVRSVRIVDQLCAHVFANRWPQVSGLWGIEDDDVPNACVAECNGQTQVLLTRGACDLLAQLGDFVGNGIWVAKDLHPRLFSHRATSAIASEDIGEITQLLGLAALFGHEVGHVLDRHYIPTVKAKHDSKLAEEISADGHAIEMGFVIVAAWASDLAAQGVFDENELRRLGTALLILANAVIDEVLLGDSWDVSPDVSHPPGAQRLMGACVLVNDHFDQVEGDFGVTVFKIVISGLKAFGVYDGPVDECALQLLIDNFDPRLVAEQYAALQRTLAERGV